VEEQDETSKLVMTLELQWGHGDGAVEECSEIADFRIGSVASMGPRRWSRGRDAAQAAGPRGQADASMGPRRWSRGRAGRERRVDPAVSCFNGATAMEPWKRASDQPGH